MGTPEKEATKKLLRPHEVIYLQGKYVEILKKKYADNPTEANKQRLDVEEKTYKSLTRKKHG